MKESLQLVSEMFVYSTDVELRSQYCFLKYSNAEVIKDKVRMFVHIVSRGKNKIT